MSSPGHWTILLEQDDVDTASELELTRSQRAQLARLMQKPVLTAHDEYALNGLGGDLLLERHRRRHESTAKRDRSGEPDSCKTVGRSVSRRLSFSDVPLAGPLPSTPRPMSFE